MPYENMLIPIVTFLRQVPGKDFGQITALQAQVLRAWYWLAIFSRRYSSAAQTSVLEDAQALEKAGKGDFSLMLPLLQKLSPVIHEYDDIYTVNRKYDALYRGILNFIHYAGNGLRNLENGNPVTSSSILEDHHIFPKDYLRRNPTLIESSLDGQVLIDCVANRTLIPKLTNIRVSSKAPSVYLGVLSGKNPNISAALESHLIPPDLVTGAYDELYLLFLEDRARLIVQGINELVMRERDVLTSSFTDSLSAAPAPGTKKQTETTVLARKNQTDVVVSTSEVGQSAQSEFRLPLLETMHELGGRALTKQVREVMRRKVASFLQSGDRLPVGSAAERWWNATQWNRFFLVKEGIFRDDSEHGVWELTDYGVKYVDTLMMERKPGNHQELAPSGKADAP